MFSLICSLLIINYVMGEISSSSDMNCDFTTSCRWRNATGPEDNGEWMHSAKLDIDPIHHIIPMKEGDGENFIYSSGLMGQTVSLLVSDVVTCQLGGANIKYWYFKTGHESRLEVCIREPPGSKDTASMRCYDGLSSTFAQQWIFRIIELPPISQPFEIIFRATFFPPADVIALDDISYDATLCEISHSDVNQGAGGKFGSEESNPTLVDFNDGSEVTFNPVFDDLKQVSGTHENSIQIPTSHGHQRRQFNFAAPTAEGTSRTAQKARIGPMFDSLCPLVDCSFDDNTFCNYVTSVTDGKISNETLRDWSISSKSILNSLTGIPYDLSRTGSFIYAGGHTVSPKDTFILSTNIPFELKEQSQLDFFVYHAGIKGRLKVCANTLTDCFLYINSKDINLDARKWKNYHVFLTTAVHAIHFVADGLADNYALGLDQIQILNKYGMAANKC